MQKASLRVCLGIAGFLLASAPCRAQFFQQTNLVSDVPSLAQHLDADLRNPWGLASSATGPFWVSDAFTGKSTIYNTAGEKQGSGIAMTGGHPTGILFNPTSDFTGDLFLFATLDGTVDGWQPVQGSSSAIRVDSRGAGAVYTGLALGNNGVENLLYAADSANNRIDVFGSDYSQRFLGNIFTDPNLPAGFTVYNIQNLGGTLYVTFENENTGGGVVDAFDLNGNLLRRVSSNPDGGPLDSPWGLALAPSTFGPFADALLVGNEEDGRINAFNPLTGAFLGTLRDEHGQPISNKGLWGLLPGNGGNGGDFGVLYFAAGIQGEVHGLFGALTFVNQPLAVPEPSSITMLVSLLAAAPVCRLRRRTTCRR